MLSLSGLKQLQTDGIICCPVLTDRTDKWSVYINVQHDKSVWLLVWTLTDTLSPNRSTRSASGPSTKPHNDPTSSFFCGRRRKEVLSFSRCTSVRESPTQRGAGSRGRGWRWRNKRIGRQRRRPSSCRYPWSGWWPQLECRTARGLRWAPWSGPSFLPGRDVSTDFAESCDRRRKIPSYVKLHLTSRSLQTVRSFTTISFDVIWYII